MDLIELYFEQSIQECSDLDYNDNPIEYQDMWYGDFGKN